ncbi:lamin tail domain-containing protein [Roseateles sp. BYS96W]|uniref:Lamin tail domain-containing protein n=1 Tax=Pelomonas nitida TaxID=3299027 RepID=A0ABW7G8K5_9BURK
MKKIKFWMAGAAATMLTAMAGCGGGGDEAHEPPTLTATLPTSATAGVPVTITGITATNTTTLTVDWGDGTQDAPATIPTSLSHTYAATATCVKAGLCTIDVAVLGWGQAVQQKGSVVVSPAPTLAATLPATGTAGVAYTITGVAAANGTALSIDWGDGTKEKPAVSSTSLTHTYATSGSYAIGMVLTGSNGSSAEQKGSIMIVDPAVLALTATLPTSGVTGTGVNITGITVSNGTALSVDWGDLTKDAADVTSTTLTHAYAATGTYTIAMTLTGPAGSTPVTKTGSITIDTPELFINRYISGSSNNKALEIYNPTGQAVDLSYYVVELWSNGRGPAYTTPVATGATPTAALHLSGTLPPGSTKLIVNYQATLAGLTSVTGSIPGRNDNPTGTSDVTAFNGDDVVLLLKSTTADTGTAPRACARDTAGVTACTVVDSFGVLGKRPTTGASWGGTATPAIRHTLHRKLGIGKGSVPTATAADPWWDPTAEYDVLDADSLTGLGSR